MRKINKLFITGVAGFVASHFCDYILKNYPEVEVIGLVRWKAPLDNIKHIQDKIQIEWGDLEDMGSLQQILNEYRPDAISHLAAQSYVDFSYRAPISTLSSNIIGTCNLLESIKILREEIVEEEFDPTIHICSSSEVYGQVQEEDVPITENCSLRPASPYAVSKVGTDRLGYQYFKSWGLKTVISRSFTHTGPRRGDVFVVSSFAKQIAEIEKKLKPEIIQVGNLSSVRTFCDVRDMVRAYWLLINKCSAGEVYNIGGNETMTIGEMLEKLLKLSTNKKIGIEVDQARLRPSDVTLQIPSTEKFHKATGWKPEISFDETLKDILDYWRENV